MNALKPMPRLDEASDRADAVPIDRETALPGETRNSRPRAGARRFVLAALLLLVGGLAVGGWQHWRAAAEVTATAAQRRDFVPNMQGVERLEVG